ncbi:hypothetical protein [Polaromonas sp.]|uniref:hypothetical protein n=1 Tax=Polaromonas sp. TaxID=1869339 RepID=UPI00352A4709
MKTQDSTSAAFSTLLNLIEPTLSAKYSPNLYEWMKRQSSKRALPLPNVYRGHDGVDWIGWMDGPYFIGARVMAVLCHGAKQGTAAYGMTLTQIPGFWETYVQTGRCAIDPEHQANFIADEGRWSSNGERRTCNWCGGFSQTLRKWTATEERSEWVSSERKEIPGE